MCNSFFSLCLCSKCPKPLCAIYSWWTAADTKFRFIPSWHSWRATNDTRKWWFGYYVTCSRYVSPSFRHESLNPDNNTRFQISANMRLAFTVGQVGTMKDFGYFRIYWSMCAGLVKTLLLELFERFSRYAFAEMKYY